MLKVSGVRASQGWREAGDWGEADRGGGCGVAPPYIALRLLHAPVFFLPLLVRPRPRPRPRPRFRPRLILKLRLMLRLMLMLRVGAGAGVRVHLLLESIGLLEVHEEQARHAEHAAAADADRGAERASHLDLPEPELRARQPRVG